MVRDREIQIFAWMLLLKHTFRNKCSVHETLWKLALHMNNLETLQVFNKVKSLVYPSRAVDI